MAIKIIDGIPYTVIPSGILIILDNKIGEFCMGKLDFTELQLSREREHMKEILQELLKHYEVIK